MSRSYAQTVTSIWRPESDFNDIVSSAQRVYWLLTTQEDISAAGVLTLAVERWAGNAPDTTAETIWSDIKELVEAGKVFVDERTQEILVRTFVKWDNGYKNTKRRPVIVRAALEVRSAALRSVLAVELEKLGINIDSLASPGRSVLGARDGLSDRPSAAGGLPAVADRTPSEYSQINRLSDPLSDRGSASDGVVANTATYIEPPSLNPHTPTRDDIRAVADSVRTVRSEWNITTVENAIRNAMAEGHTLSEIDAEFHLLATDRATRAPGRLNAVGRIWKTPTSVRSVADVETHAFQQSDADPSVCVCNYPRHNRRHSFVEGSS